jgi:RNA-binding protein YhbY
MESQTHKCESIRLLHSNKPENRSTIGDQCGANRQAAANIRPKVGIGQSALTSLEAALRLIDNVDAALAAHETIVAVAAAQ